MCVCVSAQRRETQTTHSDDIDCTVTLPTALRVVCPCHAQYDDFRFVCLFVCLSTTGFRAYVKVGPDVSGSPPVTYRLVTKCLGALKKREKK